MPKNTFLKSAVLLPFLILFSLPLVLDTHAQAPEAVEISKVETYDQLLLAIRTVQKNSQLRIDLAINQEKIRQAWETGRLIQDHVGQNQKTHQEVYGKQVMKRLSKDLGRGAGELYFTLEFSRAYSELPQTKNLTITHYRDLLRINDPEKRRALEKRAEAEGWNTTKLRLEINRLGMKKVETDLQLKTIKPGKLGVYKMVRATHGPYQGELVLDLGFSNYFKLGSMEEFKEGDLVFVKPVKHSKKGLATRYQFEKVLPAKTREEIHIATKKNPIYGDESMLYTYSATVTQVVDGDTFKAMVDLGFGITTHQKIRLLNIDTAEIVSSEGQEAKRHLEKILARENGRLLITSKTFDLHGRALAHVWVEDKLIQQELLDQGLAVAVQN